MDVSTIWDFCGEVVGTIRSKTGYVPATVTRIDNDGTVWVTTGDGGEAPASTCSAGVAVGDVVSVSWSGAQMGVVGNASDPSAGVSTVRAVRKAAESARKVADKAQDIADAIGQHFFTDDNGVHVSTEDGNPTGERNILMNSLGILLRRGSAWLASFSDSAVAFYDGLGNAAANVVASFGADGAVVGYEDGAHVNVAEDGVYVYGGSRELMKFGAQTYTSGHFTGGGLLRFMPVNGGGSFILAQNASTQISKNRGRIELYAHNVGNVDRGYNRAELTLYGYTSTPTGSEDLLKVTAVQDIYIPSEGAYAEMPIDLLTISYDGTTTFEGDLTYQGTLHGATWQAGTSGTTSGGVTTLPSSGTYILVTGHNSTPALNGVWIVRTGGNTAFNLAGGGNVTVTVSGTTLTVTTTAGTVNVYYQLCGT